MIELPLLFMAGALGSSHCVGMCGPFALMIGSGSRSVGGNLLRQTLYTAGRVFTYCILGVVCGFAGKTLQESVPSMMNLPALLATGAGLFLVYQGLVSTGIWKSKHVVTGKGGCLSSGLFASFLTDPSRRSVFLAGVFTGLLPCGLLYGMLTLAASSRDVLAGAGTMAVFGLGTAPSMLATGLGGGMLSFAMRRHLNQVAAWSLVLTGVVSVVRGVVFFVEPWTQAGGCPFCKM